jgi:hypothetical protein
VGIALVVQHRRVKVLGLVLLIDDARSDVVLHGGACSFDVDVSV